MGQSTDGYTEKTPQIITIALYTVLFVSAGWIADKFLHEISGLSRYFKCLIHLKAEVVK